MENMVIEKSFSDIYRGKKVLITGNTGFKGSWLSIWLMELGAEVLGVSLEPKNKLDNFNVSNLKTKTDTKIQDIRDYDSISSVFEEFKPEMVFHLAAQALVSTSYDDPRLTFETNFIGTLNILEAIKNQDSVKAGVLITSDKCYKNIEQIWGYRENDLLGGNDPYSASKACAEILINSYIKSCMTNNKALIASSRAGNVIGGGDWSENRLIPDSFKALYDDRPIIIRNSDSTRPWQFVLEPLKGYLMLGEQLLSGSENHVGSWNFGPPQDNIFTVGEVVEYIIRLWGKGEMQNKNNNMFSESNLLQLDCTKSITQLGWKPSLDFKSSFRFVTDWYKYLKENDNIDMYQFCVDQINEYENI
jgi:CDP-glucose 4,6-dehydratase